jgi:glycosyltransferase involved in cell wall biosynthesis
LRIAQLAPTYERVPPHTYGGTELVVSLVTEGLIRRGHDVTLYATRDSLTDARLAGPIDHRYRYGADDDGVRHAEHAHLANVQAAFRDAVDGRFDLIQNHAGLEGVALAAWSRTPVLTTTHNAWTDVGAAIWDAYPWAHHQLSAAQASAFPDRGRLAPIHHGIDIANYTPRITPSEEDAPLVFLGRFSPAKGADTAVAVARRTGRRLLLAGKVDQADRPWFETHIAPLVDGGRIRVVGEVDGPAKARLLAEAAALLFPIAWDEPFGLVVVEALAAGTPVIGMRRASVPELVDHAETGFVVDDAEGMAQAVAQLDVIDRGHCRRVAERRFGVDRMLDELEDRMGEAIDRGPTRPIPGREAQPVG